MSPETIRYSIEITDESASVMPSTASASDRVQQLAGVERTDLPVAYVRSLCRLEGSVVVSASRCLQLREEGAIEKAEPEGDGQRVWFEVVGAGTSRRAALLDSISLLRELGFTEEADLISLQERG